MTEEELKAWLLQNGYVLVRKRPDGVWIGVQPMLFTVALMEGLDMYGYQRRFCYERLPDALEAAQRWKGYGDPPGPWIKEKPGDRLGPGAVGEFADARVGDTGSADRETAA